MVDSMWDTLSLKSRDGEVDSGGIGEQVGTKEDSQNFEIS